ncbi:MAG: potassium channel protein [Acidobacteria bacterium]|nr:potassium channel protein [Acidobacteriota bacterium]
MDTEPRSGMIGAAGRDVRSPEAHLSVNTLTRRCLLVAALLVSATVIGTLGFRLIEGWPVFDAFYMALITLTTVGYGEVYPLTFNGRVFASFLMLIGVTTVFVSFAILGDTLLRLELGDYFGRRRRTRMLKEMSGHYIVCGAGRVGRSVVLELMRGHARVVLIDNDPDRARWGETLGIVTLTADASKDETLRQARIDTAAGLVTAISSDAENVYVALSAKVLNPALHIAARASDEQAEEKLRRAGATTVLTPYAFIGHRLAHSLLRPHVVSFLDVASAFRKSELDLEIEQLPIAAGSFLSFTTLGEAHLGRRYGVIVVAVQRLDGVMQFNPQADLRLETGDVLIAMGERQKLKQLESELRP